MSRIGVAIAATASVGVIVAIATAAVLITSCGGAASSQQRVDQRYRVVHVVHALGLDPQAVTAGRPFVLASSDGSTTVATLSLARGRRVSVFKFGGVRRGLGLVRATSWAPTGRAFVASVASVPPGRGDRLVLVRMATRRRTTVRAAVFRPTPQAMALSPDERYVVVPGAGDYRPEGLYAYDLRTRRTTRLLAGPVGIGTNISWSPDGRHIAFSRDPGRGGGISILDLAARRVRRLTDDGVDPAWSRRGDMIAFVSQRGGAGRTCTEDGCEPSQEIFSVRADGRDRRRLTRTTAEESRPAWSADAGHLVAQVMEDESGGAEGIVLLRADGSCYRPVAAPSAGEGYNLGSDALRPTRRPLTASANC